MATATSETPAPPMACSRISRASRSSISLFLFGGEAVLPIALEGARLRRTRTERGVGAARFFVEVRIGIVKEMTIFRFFLSTSTSRSLSLSLRPFLFQHRKTAMMRPPPLPQTSRRASNNNDASQPSSSSSSTALSVAVEMARRLLLSDEVKDI